LLLSQVELTKNVN